MIAAGVITILIACGWFLLRPVLEINRGENPDGKRAEQSLEESWNKISTGFNIIKNQVFSTSTDMSKSTNGTNTTNGNE